MSTTEKLYSREEVEIKALQTSIRNRNRFIRGLNILVWVFSFVLVVGGILGFYSIKETSSDVYNWIRLIFTSVMMVSFGTLVIVLSCLIKKLVSNSNEE